MEVIAVTVKVNEDMYVKGLLGVCLRGHRSANMGAPSPPTDKWLFYGLECKVELCFNPEKWLS